MAEPRIRWRQQGFAEMRRLPAVKQYLHNKARAGANAAGDGFVARSADTPVRARAAVIAATIRARRANARDHTLMGPAMDAMRS